MEMSIRNLHTNPGAGAGAGGERKDEDVKPYRIHVSSKYLDLTKKKLELTRLPHELLLPKERGWELGTPKSEVEPLVDFWLERYDWRSREKHLNNNLPQFRTAISVPDSPHPLRIHFIHIRSSLPGAVPLLLVPSFPLTNLSLAPLFTSLTQPEGGGQAFHLVVPSLPGLGFSDALLAEGGLLSTTAGMMGILMRRLGYEVWLASATGSGRYGVAGVDYHLLRMIGEEEGCAGVNMIDPVIERPRIEGQLWRWLKFNVARFFHAEVWGYEKMDFLTLRRRERRGISAMGLRHGLGLGLEQPSTLSYALCDSPVGLLSFVCAGLRRMNPSIGLTHLEIVDLTQLAWLPGPEAGMRFVCAAQKEIAGLDSVKTKAQEEKGKKSRVAVTVFGGDAGDGGEEHNDGYTCPAWASLHHEVLWSRRLPGLPGLLFREHSVAISDGIRGLTQAVLKLDGRLSVAVIEQVVVHIDSEEVADDGAIVEIRELGSVDMDAEWDSIIDEEEESEGDVMQLDVGSPDTVVGIGSRR